MSETVLTTLPMKKIVRQPTLDTKGNTIWGRGGGDKRAITLIVIGPAYLRFITPGATYISSPSYFYGLRRAARVSSVTPPHTWLSLLMALLYLKQPYPFMTAVLQITIENVSVWFHLLFSASIELMYVQK